MNLCFTKYDSNVQSLFNRLHTRRCRLRHGQDVLQRLFSDDNFPIRSSQPFAPKHEQAQAAARAMAERGRRFESRVETEPDLESSVVRRHDRETSKEANVDRQLGARRSSESLSPKLETDFGGDSDDLGQSLSRQRSRSSLVLQ
jgi:hypothetical protein